MGLLANPECLCWLRWPWRTSQSYFVFWFLFLSCIFWPLGVKKVEFWPILAILEYFHTEKQKKWMPLLVEMTLEDITKLLFSEVAYFGHQVWIKRYFDYFLIPILAILENFCTDEEKIKKCESSSSWYQTDKNHSQKYHACFHALCVHTGMCTALSIFYPFGRPNFTFGEGLVKIWIHLVTLWGFEKNVMAIKKSEKGPKICKLHVHFHVLCIDVRLCMTLNVINQLRRPKLTNTEVSWRFEWDRRIWRKSDGQKTW